MTPSGGAAQPTPAPSLEELLYVRGFTLSPEPGAVVRGDWTTHRLGRWVLAHDPQIDLHSAAVADAEVVVLGLVIDTRAWGDAQAAVRSAAAALAESESRFLDVVDGWSGRHLVVWRSGARVRAMTDATGMRTCFYNLEGELTLSSHASLAAEITGAPRVEPTFRQDPRWGRGVGYFPGRLTPWEGIVFLTANSALDLETRELHRVWPRRELVERNVGDAATELGESLPQQMRWLANLERPIVVSLTGGIDSRVTLAAARAVAAELTFFTYRRAGNPDHAADAEVASQLAGAAGLRHLELVIPADRGAHGAVTERALATNSFLSHFRGGAEMYRRSFSPTAIHVRSNVAEIGRYFFDKRGKGVELSTPKDMATLWKQMDDVPEAAFAFGEWAEAVGFWSVSELDPLDLFYWEHRLPCWHGCVVLESDVAFDTHSLYNCRRIIEVLLSVPTRARRRGRLFNAFIEATWPELARFRFV